MSYFKSIFLAGLIVFAAISSYAYFQMMGRIYFKLPVMTDNGLYASEVIVSVKALRINKSIEGFVKTSDSSLKPYAKFFSSLQDKNEQVFDALSEGRLKAYRIGLFKAWDNYKNVKVEFISHHQDESILFITRDSSKKESGRDWGVYKFLTGNKSVKYYPIVKDASEEADVMLIYSSYLSKHAMTEYSLPVIDVLLQHVNKQFDYKVRENSSVTFSGKADDSSRVNKSMSVLFDGLIKSIENNDVFGLKAVVTESSFKKIEPLLKKNMAGEKRLLLKSLMSTRIRYVIEGGDVSILLLDDIEGIYEGLLYVVNDGGQLKISGLGFLSQTNNIFDSDFFQNLQR